MNEHANLEKLIYTLQQFVKCLDRLQDLCVHRTISQSYYMQKVAELEFLHLQMKELFERHEANKRLISLLVPEVYDRWKQDALWLKDYFTRHSIECLFIHDLSM